MILMASTSSYDSESTAPSAGHDQTIDIRPNDGDQPARRRRRVRLNYPAPLVQLAVNLQQRVGIRRTAGLLGLQLSTLYRWVGHHNAIYQRNHTNPVQPFPPDLAARCRESGFPVDGAVLLHLPEAAAAYERPRHGATRVDGHLPIVREVSVVESASDSTRDKIMAAKALLDQRFVEPWTCGRLAVRYGLSRLHFIRVFARYVGVPPYQYLTRVRVERARQLSMEPNRPLRTIAREVGFGSISSLHRAFHRYLGAPPGELFNCAGNF
jgi:AraC-like DNA-binding protein